MGRAVMHSKQHTPHLDGGGGPKSEQRGRPSDPQQLVHVVQGCPYVSFIRFEVRIGQQRAVNIPPRLHKTRLQ